MSELKIGKRYTYKNHVYEIVNLGRMKSDEDWVDAVGYKRVLEDGDEQYEKVDTTTVYTRSRAMFEELFIPRNLEVGDRIIAMSMGKILRTYEVVQISEDNSVRYRFTEGPNYGEECFLVSFSDIEFNGRVFIKNPDNNMSHINCVEYYFVSYRVMKIIDCKNKIDGIRSKLMNIHEAFGKVDIATFRNDEILYKYYSEITKLIEQIQKDGYIKWPQSKKQ